MVGCLAVALLQVTVEKNLILDQMWVNCHGQHSSS